jgi:hypothetical protein
VKGWIVRSENGLQRLERQFEAARRLARVDRQLGVAVLQREHAVVKHDDQLAALEHASVLIAEDRQQQLGVQLLVLGRPLDVEEHGRGRARTVLEDVVPPGVPARADAHVIRHEVGEVSEAMRRERGPQRREPFHPAELRIDLVVIRHVVAVRAPRPGREVRRRVAGRHAERRQVRHDVASGGQRKTRM